MGNCKDCQFWKPSTVRKFIHERPNWKTCMLALQDGQENIYKDSLAWSSDFEAYLAELYTSPEYGCVQFKELTQ